MWNRCRKKTKLALQKSQEAEEEQSAQHGNGKHIYIKKNRVFNSATGRFESNRNYGMILTRRKAPKSAMRI